MTRSTARLWPRPSASAATLRPSIALEDSSAPRTPPSTSAGRARKASASGCPKRAEGFRRPSAAAAAPLAVAEGPEPFFRRLIYELALPYPGRVAERSGMPV